MRYCLEDLVWYDVDSADRWYVYLLIDDRDGAPFYVGISVDPVVRLLRHISDPGSSAWWGLQEILDADPSTFRFLVVGCCTSRSQAYRIEARLIDGLTGLVNRTGAQRWRSGLRWSTSSSTEMEDERLRRLRRERQARWREKKDG